MAATKAFRVSLPHSNDLVAARRAWDFGQTVHTADTTTSLYRVVRADSRDEALSFAKTCYPSDTKNRFSPVWRDGAIAPAAYAASTRELALWETVLRNVRHKGERLVPQHATAKRYLIEVKLLRPLKLLNIVRPYDQRLVAGRKHAPSLSAATPVGYDNTREWAQQLYLKIPEMDGIWYESHQLPGNCMVIYQPGEPTVFDTVGDALGCRAEPVLGLLRTQATMAGAVIDFGLVPEIPIDE